MGCSNCGSADGCGNKGGCATGGCNRLNTFDWLSDLEIPEYSSFDLIEVSFKQGTHKDFYSLPRHMDVHKGNMVVVNTDSGYDVGQVSLTGELVRLQMKKKRIREDRTFNAVVRHANERDLEKLAEARSIEKTTLIRARAIARMLDLEMKVGDVEYQGDKRKATFYFTANGRVDFRELIRHYAKDFKVKIEMRQIGSRQESALIGGLGSCGRELCCSTWLTNFQSVTTQAARYQNLSINQSKLSGLCGRLKCCLNYELDMYAEAIDLFPMKSDKLQARNFTAYLIKVDIFKRLMFYSIKDELGRSRIVGLPIERVEAIKEMNKNGEKPEKIEGTYSTLHELDEPEVDFIDVTGQIEIKEEKKKRRKKRGPRGKNQSRDKKPNPSAKRKNNNKRGNKSKPSEQKSNHSKKNNNEQS